jgi:MarR family 2-MHQ and catechol resistance regulon transcriptional repressor
MTAALSPSPASRIAADTPAEATFRSLIRTFGALERVMQPYFMRFGISGAQWGVLRTLQRAEDEGVPSLRVTELSQRLLIRPPSVTGVVDRLVREGLVIKESLPSDLRVKQVSLTPVGRQRVHDVLDVHGAQVAKVLSGLLPAEQTEFGRLLDRLREHLGAMAEASDVEPKS